MTKDYKLNTCSASAAYLRYQPQVGRLCNSLDAAKTGLPDVQVYARSSTTEGFGHVRRLPEGTPLHDALHASVELLATLRLILAGDRSREDHGAADYGPTGCPQSDRPDCSGGLDSG